MRNKNFCDYGNSILFTAIIIILIMLVVMISFTLVAKNFKPTFFQHLTYLNCCNNSPCSDTYYTPENNLCHLVLCENLYGKNNPKCVYQGANKSFDALAINSKIERR